nr:zinc finger, CCHC-type [Tanacetum cinerariifolium]
MVLKNDKDTSKYTWAFGTAASHVILEVSWMFGGVFGAAEKGQIIGVFSATFVVYRFCGGRIDAANLLTVGSLRNSNRRTKTYISKISPEGSFVGEDEKCVWFEVELQGTQGDREAEEKVHLGIKVGANITVTEVPGQEGVKGNVAEKKKVEESMKANLKKLLKATVGPVVVWMVFPRLDPGSMVLMDPGKPCTERKPVKGE